MPVVLFWGSLIACSSGVPSLVQREDPRVLDIAKGSLEARCSKV
jgi:hypothetical protein